MKFYIASPFWNGEEKPNVEKTRDILRGKGFDVFVPMEHEVEDGENLPNDVWGQKIFEIDRDAIKGCDIVVALYYGLYSDSGTAWEIGYASCLGKKVIIVHCNKSAECSLMIANCATLNLTDIEQLKDLDYSKLSDFKSGFKIEQK